MKFRERLKDRQFWTKVLLWSLLLCIAPFALEMVILADVMGIEIAMAFFAYYLKDAVMICQAKWHRFLSAVGFSFMCVASHALGQPSYLVPHFFFSAFYFILSGSMIWALLVWYPILVLGGSAVGGAMVGGF